MFLLYCILLAFCLPVSGKETLQSQIEKADEGDTVLVKGGTFQENILITKQITLLGTEKPKIIGTGTGSIITVLAPYCEISGFFIEHSGSMLVNEDAGILLKSNHNKITNNNLSDVLFGIYLFKSDSNYVAENKICGKPALSQGERGSGIHVWNSNFNLLERNTIFDTRDGFYIQNANHTEITDNEVYHVRYGLHYMYADSNVFLRNLFRDNVAGAAIMFTRKIVMKHNIFLRNRGFASYGMLLQDCHDSVADSNIFSDNVIGLFFESSTNNLFRSNIIARNDLALQMFQNSTQNTFTENNFIDNLNPLTIVGRKTESNWSLNGKGNYWSSYSGYDLDKNGIGDVPMNIENVFSFLEGKNGNIRLYLYSPASQALAISAKAFPILENFKELDNAPLIEPVTLQWYESMISSAENHIQKTKASVFSWLIPLFVSILTAALLGFWKVKE